MIPMTMELEEEETDDLEEYTFPKFAATYFQGSSTHTHIQRQLRHPLLYHDEKDDILVAWFLFVSVYEVLLTALTSPFQK